MTQHSALPFVLLPGFMLDASLWDNVRPMLEAYAPVYALECTQGDTLESMATALLQQCPEHFILVGFSMGGYIAREMTGLAPERIAALVLVASSLREDTAQQTSNKMMAIEAIRNGRPFKGISQKALRASVHPDHADQATLGRLHAMGERLGADVFIRQSLLARPSTPLNTTGITCPTLVIAAQDDALRSLEEAQEMADTLPHATLEIIEHCGHMIPIEQPHALALCITAWLHSASLLSK